MLRRLSTLVVLGIAFALVGCGKNEVVYPYAPQPGQPIYQAPVPGQPGYGYPGSYPGGNTGYPGGFSPQMPGGYPSGYTPFLPVDYFMRNNPQLSGQWPGMWNGWRNYSQRYGYNSYDFNRFWFEYCPQQWRNGSFLELYLYLDNNFYFWVQPQTQFAPQMNPQKFWGHYQGYGYGNMWGLYY